MENIASSITDLIGRTPLLRLQSNSAELLAKLEFLNPGGSVKDRAALAIVEDAERRNLLRKGSVLVDATSGNTGIALAMVAASKGYGCVVSMPRVCTNVERYALIKAYGGVVLLSEPNEGAEGMLRLAKKAADALGDRAYYTAQFSNPCNADAHLHGTGPELWRQCGGRLDAVVLGAGTGGTASGITRALRSLASENGVEPPRIIVVEPELSRTLSGGVHHNGHGVTGIGAGVPLAFVCNKGDVDDREERVQVDEFRSCSLADALDEARAVSMRDGVLAGPSSGAALRVARDVASELGAGKRVVVILPSAGERYLTHPLFDAHRRSAEAELGLTEVGVDDQRELRKLQDLSRPEPSAHSSNDPVVETRRALENELARMAAELLNCETIPVEARLEDLGATSLTAARLLGKLALAGRDSEFPGAKVALLKVALLGSVRDLARVLLRLDSDDAPFHGGTVPDGYVVRVNYCGG
jgi:cysteine synthase A